MNNPSAKMNVKFWFVFIFITLALSGFAQSSFSISSKIVDSLSSAPVPFATITLASKVQPKTILKTSVTDGNGLFTLVYNKKGNYQLGIHAIGKQSVILDIVLADETKLKLDQIVVKDLSVELGAAVITAQKPLVKVDIDKLTYDTEADPESQSSNVLEMLRKVPLVTVDGEDNIQVKGNSSFKIYINGKPSTMLSNNPSQVLKSMPANSIKSIEIITEPGAKYDAEGVTGIINIITNKGVTDGYTANINSHVNNFGSFGGNVYLAVKKGKFGFSGNYGYSRWRNPYNDSYTSRIDSVNSLVQNGKAKMTGPSQFGNGELSFELDSLNLFSLSFNRFIGRREQQSELEVSSEYKHQASKNFIYNRNTLSESEFGGSEIGLDYQKSFRKKGVLLTSSYFYNYSPNNSLNTTEIIPISNYNAHNERGVNTASTKEHTIQLDYVNPITKKHSIEVGSKYILRLNSSEIDIEYLNHTTGLWEDQINLANDLDYTQSVLSAYSSYSFKTAKFGVKSGLRFEHTNSDVRFPGKINQNFKANFNNVVPTINLSYQLTPTQTLKTGYNMRIQRPGIWYLNPYVNNSDPLNISYGNPNLDAEKSHNVNLSYAIFTPKFNINANLFYSITNNAIQQIVFMQSDTLHTTYKNLGVNQMLGLNLYASWSVTNQFKLNLNGGLNHSTMDSQLAGQSKTSGFHGYVFGGGTYTLPKDFRIGFNAGMFKRQPSLQTKRSGSHFTSISFGKDFLEKKLGLTLALQDPFTENKKFTSTTSTPYVEQYNEMNFKGRSVRFNISYRFGELKSQIKKVQRGINNEDVKAGERENNGN